MNEQFVAVKAALTAATMAIASFLGWRGIMAVVWVVLMAIDYLTGSAAALKGGEWCSTTAREGLWHKGGMIAVVVVAAIADGVMVVMMENLSLGISWPGIVLPLVLAWYILTEAGSVLENAVKMGAAVPEWLTKALKISLSAVNKAGETAANESEAKEE